MFESSRDCGSSCTCSQAMNEGIPARVRRRSKRDEFTNRQASSQFYNLQIPRLAIYHEAYAVLCKNWLELEAQKASFVELLGFCYDDSKCNFQML